MSVAVAVTGLGAVTPLGPDVPSLWSAALDGRCGVRTLDGPGFDALPVRLAAPVLTDPTTGLDRASTRRLDRCQHLAMTAALEAWHDSGMPGLGVPAERVGVSVGSCVGGLTSLIATNDALRDKGPRHVSPFTIPRIIPDGAASWIGLEIGARAAIQTPLAACATGNDAIRQGVELIRHGLADVVLVGGTEAAIHPMILAAFAAMRALCARNDEPESASCPFDARRDGFVMGEGAAMLVLEEAQHARGRGARIYAEVAGTGYSADGFDFAQPDPSGAGQIAAMRRALQDAELSPADVGHVNAHAASTPVGDAVEAASLRSALGGHADEVVVTASKSGMGHLMGAAGAAETLLAVLALHHRVVPPTIGLDKLDDAIDLDVALEPRRLPGGELAALSNSFGLGGHNVIVALRSA